MSTPKEPGSPIPSWVYRYGLMLGIALTATAFWRSTPLMSGQLSAVHAGFESECQRCHASVGGGSQDDLCRKCHADIGTTSRAVIHKGMREHCAACHQEHRSREYPLRLSDPEGFKHDLTGFSLERWHKNVACNACHGSGGRFYDVKRTCRDCHPGWKPANFDHAKIIGVGLLLHHSDAGCSDCHPKNRYEDPPTCDECHDSSMKYRPGEKL
jgi:hypothetical protein